MAEGCGHSDAFLSSFAVALSGRQSVHGVGRKHRSERGQRMNEAIRLEIETLRTLKTKALQERYRELFGEPSPSSNPAHLFRRVAWRLQANIAGGLSQEAQVRAAELAVDADGWLHAQ